MSERGEQLQATIDHQIAELIDLLSAIDQTALRRPCAGRQRLGDGTLAANAWHTADNYQRIAAFVRTSDRGVGDRRQRRPGRGHRIPQRLRRLGHRRPDHDQAGGSHGERYTLEGIDVKALCDQLTDARQTLMQLRQFTDQQLDTIPPNGSFRFCDGQRTLEQVLTSLLKHQRHQLNALQEAAG
jgi:hypothetical protein